VVEYVGVVPRAELEGKTAAQKRALLVAAARAARDEQLTPVRYLGLSGPVTL
jgi:hypothetical protein